MLKNTLLLIALVSILFACNSNNETKKIPVTDIEVATSFIRDLLDNNLADARTLMLNDEKNQQTFDLVERKMKAASKEEQEKYKNADIIINNVETVVKDSVTIINYSNSSYKESKNKIKVVRMAGKWLVDFQYTFSGNM